MPTLLQKQALRRLNVERPVRSRIRRLMAETRVRLPFGGCASSNPEEVRAPRWKTRLIAVGASIAVAWLLLKFWPGEP